MYLNKRRQGWYLEWTLPKDIKPLFGKGRLVQSLGTRDKDAAEARAIAVKNRWRAEVEMRRQRAGVQPKDVGFWRAMADTALSPKERADIEHMASIEAGSRNPYWWREGYQAAPPDEKKGYEQMVREYVRETYLDYDDCPYDTIEEHPEAAKFVALAIGKTRAFDEHLDEWAKTLRVEAKTIFMRRKTVRDFAQEFRLTSDVTRKGVQRWARAEAAKGKSPATIQRALSELRGYWKFLEGLEAVPDDTAPFDKIVLPAKSAKELAADKRQDFSAAEVARLHAGALANDDQQLADLIDIARYTGARLEEICGLRVEHVTADAKSLIISNAKTEAGNREVPIHPNLAATIERLKKPTLKKGEKHDGFLLTGLTPNKFGDRSGALSKRFARLRTDQGFDGTRVFHSIRKTVATLLDNAGVPENVAADILGHEKPRITYGLYSGGASLATKAEALSKLNYPSHV